MSQVNPRSLVCLLNLPLLFVVICVSSQTSQAENSGQTSNTPPRPHFAIRVGNQPLKIYTDSQVADEWISAVVTHLNPKASTWELQIKVKDSELTEVWFPWESEPKATSHESKDDIVYSTYRLGVAHLASSLSSKTWLGHMYPGEAFAPLVVTANETHGRMVAAVNWPPKQATAKFARGRMAVLYHGKLLRQRNYDFKTMIATAESDSINMTRPWHLLLDKYKAWLLPHMKEEKLYPIAYTNEVRKANGWMHVSLHWLPKFDAHEIQKLYDDYKETFPWIQFWGQMSNYQRAPGEGRKAFATPPLSPNEKVGCCVDRPSVHRRYQPQLKEVFEYITKQGGMIGFYTRPKSPYKPLTHPDCADLKFLTDWIQENKLAGANAFYLDVLGAKYFGDALGMANILKKTLPGNSIIEWPVDIYPTSFLIGGSLWGGLKYNTRPGQSLSSLGENKDKVTFVNFGRYLLDDRIMFLGRSNGDWMWWGNFRKYHNWTERQAFLLGAKFDAATRFKGQRGWINPVNSVVKSVVEEWKRVHWWERQLKYRDRVGIEYIPDGFNVRRFVDEDGINFFVVDNLRSQTGQFMKFEGRSIALPAKKISIVVDKVK